MLNNMMSTIKTYAKTAYALVKEYTNIAINKAKETVNQIKEYVVAKLTTTDSKDAQEVDGVEVVVVDETTQEQTKEGGTTLAEKVVAVVAGILAFYIVCNLPITILFCMELYFVTKVIIFAIDKYTKLANI